MSNLKICIPGLFTHAHRTHERRLELEKAFNDANVNVVASYSPDCDALLFGDHSVFTPELLQLSEDKPCPIVHYVWDIYNCNIHGPNWAGWSHYLGQLHKADKVLAPSECTVRQLEKTTGRTGVVVKAPVRIWDKPTTTPAPHLLNSVIDVMRTYPDKNAHIVHRACVELGLPCVASKTAFNWDDFRHAVGNARLLVSGYEEASTGGLTVIEGYWHGVPSLLSNSPLNGVVDYLGDRADYFQWDNFEDFKQKLNDLWHNPRKLPDERERRDWIVKEYSEETYVGNLIKEVKELL